jgi:hypothetical protein
MPGKAVLAGGGVARKPKLGPREMGAATPETGKPRIAASSKKGKVSGNLTELSGIRDMAKSLVQKNNYSWY